jgi:3-deoxy-D-manno-octulosonate 8-phosphate phosphatase (KDO 8-P phosphatase)
LPASKTDFRRKARGVTVLLLDVDGVLTDGRLVLDERGRENKCFHVHDGQGIRWLLKSGVEVGIISGRSSGAVQSRARELGITLLFQGVQDKWAVLQKLLKRKGWRLEQVAYAGDDLPDLPLLQRVGLSIGVPNGHPLTRRQVDYVTRTLGGWGAVREVAEELLKSQGKWGSLMKSYAAGTGPELSH